MRVSATKALLVAVLAGNMASVASAQSLSTTTPNNGSGGIFLDLTPAGGSLNFDSFATYFSSAVGTAVSVEVWTRPGTYVGFTGSNAGWTLTQTVSATSAGSTALSAPVPLTTPILLAGGTTTGVYLHATTTGGGIRYTGTASIPPQTTWTNSDLTLFSDVARTGTVAFAGTANTPRTFAGTVFYSFADPNETGACCMADGSCQVINPANCVTLGGAYHGANSDCVTANCPQPRACCFPDGTCGVMFETACTAQGGVFNAGATTCAAANCPQPPTGGCCLPDATCVVVWQGGCVAQGGVYGGDNTTCATANCMNVVVPNGSAGVEGGTSNSFPFTSTNTYFHYQQVYAASDFAGLTGPHRITGMQFRPNATSTAPVWSNTFDLNLRLSTTQAGPDALSATFTDNVGADEAVVYSGPVTISTNQVTPINPGPALFDVSITFQTPFVYDPANGNLLINLERNGSTIGTNRFLDAVSVVGDAVGRVTTSTVGATTGTVTSIGLVTRFLVEPAGPAPCYPNCDGSTIPPILNVLDFSCFLNSFSAGESYANCDGSTIPPVLNVLDFSCFLNSFSAGCP